MKKRLLMFSPALLILSVGLYFFWGNVTNDPIHDMVLLLATGVPATMLAVLYLTLVIRNMPEGNDEKVSKND